MALRRKKTVAKKRVGKKVRQRTASAPSSDIASLIKPVALLPFVISAVFYGRPGSGKTTLASTFPGPVLMLDIGDKGWDSVADVEDTYVASVDTWTQLEELYWHLKTAGGYTTVVIDGASGLQGLAADHILTEGSREPTDHLSKRDFGTMGKMLTTWITNYRDLTDEGINVIFLLHQKTISSDNEGSDDEVMPEVGPRMMPSVSDFLCGAVKVIGHTFIRQRVLRSRVAGQKAERRTDFCLRVAPHGVYTSKVRTPRGSYTPEFLVDPTYDKLAQVMRGEFKPPAKSSKPVAKTAAKRRRKRA